jgi:NAD(P)-dependent dehydrogenase (short-subunit alcohol dehydrogenase family)
VSGAGSALIIGGASDIGRALARVYAEAGYALTLTARQAAQLEVDRLDLAARYGATVTLAELDVLDSAAIVRFVAALPATPDIVLCVVGRLGDQAQAEADIAAAESIMRATYLGPALLLGELANRLQRQGRGVIVGISSVAGERGRASNYLYGSAKAGLTAFLSGLRQRLAPHGVQVLTVKPGYVDTAMTAHLTLPPLLTAQPAEVARAIRRAQLQGQDVLYVRPIWGVIMAVIRLLPERLFKRLRL